MSGEGVLPAPAAAREPGMMVSRVAVAFALEARANAIEAAVRPDRLQPHSRKLPTEAEMDAARFAARQLRVAADDVRAGVGFARPATEEETE